MIRNASGHFVADGACVARITQVLALVQLIAAIVGQLIVDKTSRQRLLNCSAKLSSSHQKICG
jgi:hypothetical protein